MNSIFKCLIIIIFFGMSLNGYAASKEFYGRSIPLTVVLDETGEVLTLRGVALDKYFFEDNYIGAFYSLNPVKDEKQALADEGPKRMAFYILRTSSNFRDTLQVAIEENNSPQMVQREQINISQFLKIFDITLHEGDVIILDCIPKMGIKIMVRGTVKAVIKDTEIYNLILKTWMGRQPPSKKFRKDLFNLT
jgi:hypothetical protein